MFFFFFDEVKDIKKRSAFDTVINIVNNFKIPILIGHRRVGKTTLMKQISNEFQNPKFLSLDDLDWSSKKAHEVKESLFEIIEQGHDLLLLDEIQGIDQWDKVLKNIFDTYVAAKKIKVIVTGSSSLTFSNREFGLDRTKRILLGTLSYPEYLDITGDVKSFENFENFLSIGGFPEYAKNKTPSNNQYKDILVPLLNVEIPFHYKLRGGSISRLLIEIAHNTNGEFSRSKSSKNTGVSETQIDEYLNILEECQVIKRVTRINEKGVVGKYPKFKLYINPHFHLWLLDKTFEQLDNKYKGHIIESYWLFVNSQIGGIFDRYYYLKDNNDREIDFVTLSRDRETVFENLIEFKYSEKINIDTDNPFTNIKAKKKIIYCKESKTTGNIEFRNIIDFDFKDRIEMDN